MGYSAREIIPRFVQYAGQPHGYEPDGKPWQHKPGRRLRQRFPADRYLSYWSDEAGRVIEIRSHYEPLGRLVFPPGAKRRWILNGDRWRGGAFGSGSSINEHNTLVREAVQRTRTPWYIIPFSAASAAGIQLDTIVPVAVDEERYTDEEHTAATLERVPEGYRKRRVFRDQDGHEITPPPVDGQMRHANPDHHGGWYVYGHSALNGYAREPVDGPAYERITDEYEDIEPDSDGVYRWSEQRHWLGESVIRARVDYWDRERDVKVTGERWFLSAFDSNEPFPLWFLAELPAGARPHTVAAAREALKPARVRAAEAMGREILRQGDVFAIRTDFATRELRGANMQRSASVYVLGVNHVATEVRVIDGVTYARGFLRHRPPFRRPEHVTLQLGDRRAWYELVRNTVPSRRAWALEGRVD